MTELATIAEVADLVARLPPAARYTLALGPAESGCRICDVLGKPPASWSEGAAAAAWLLRSWHARDRAGQWERCEAIYRACGWDGGA